MKLMTNQALGGSGLFKLKGNDWLVKQRVAGRACVSALNMLEQEVKDKTTKSMELLSTMAETIMLEAGCTPTFKGYKGFPAAVCISVNRELVHGIPGDYKLQEGDVVKFDLGATFEGAIADTAITCIFGEPKPGHAKMVAACRESLMKGIQAVAVGKKLGVIGHAISRSVRGNGFNVITDYGGHGLDWDRPHAPPFVENKSDPDTGFRIQAGLAIAIEPMVVPYDIKSSVAKDGWTVVTKEVGCHFEHSIYVHEDHVEIITDRG